MEDLRGKMKRGAAWMVGFKLLERSLGLISVLILARLLAPADFGLVAMATSLIALLELFSSFGLDTALIWHREPTRSHYDTAWTLNVIAGCTIAGLMLALAIPTSHYYHEPRVIHVICTLALGAAIQGCENVGVVGFRKEMRFDLEFRFLLSKKILTFLITVPLAFWLRNYWALVAGMLAGRIGGVILSYILHPYRPKLSTSAVHDLMHFSKWLVVQNLLGFLNTRSSDLIIGHLAGSRALGLFSVSSEISNMPGTDLVAPINRAILPAYVKLAQDKRALAAEYVSVMSIITLVAVPAVAGLAATAPYVVQIVLGPKWHDAGALLQVLAFFGIAQVIQSNAYSAFLALGRPKTYVMISSIQAVTLLVSLVILTSLFGVGGSAWAYVLTAVLVLPVNFAFIAHYLEIRARTLIAAIARAIMASAVMYLGIKSFRSGPVPPDMPEVSAVAGLAVSVLIGLLIYVAVELGLWLLSGRPVGAETWILGQARFQLIRAKGLLRRLAHVFSAP